MSDASDIVGSDSVWVHKTIVYAQLKNKRFAIKRKADLAKLKSFVENPPSVPELPPPDEDPVSEDPIAEAVVSPSPTIPAVEPVSSPSESSHIQLENHIDEVIRANSMNKSMNSSREHHYRPPQLVGVQPFNYRGSHPPRYRGVNHFVGHYDFVVPRGRPSRNGRGGTNSKRGNSRGFQPQQRFVNRNRR